jgi:hypothetical protein
METLELCTLSYGISVKVLLDICRITASKSRAVLVWALTVATHMKEPRYAIPFNAYE